MLFACVSKPDLLKNLGNIDGVELRLDLYPWTLSQIQEALQKYLCILTLRGSIETEEKIIEILKVEPPFFDLEIDMNEAFISHVIQNFPKTKFILSYHNFEKTPRDLESIYQKMSKFCAYRYKIATMTNSSCDALRLLIFSKEYPKLSAICMGEKGKFARAMGAVFGNSINYCTCSKDEVVAPGQLVSGEMLETYRYHQLTSDTHLYGLIGDPVDTSQGHQFHNEVFSKRGINAQYVKIPVTKAELSEFLPFAKKAGFRGLSVTMPLKEEVVSHIDDMDTLVKNCRACNTLKFDSSKIIGTNTDGVGALDAIEKKITVKGKKMVILGAGGAARAIAYIGKHRGADVWIVNRTKNKGQKVASDLGINVGEFPKSYDILIGCLPSNAPVDSEWVRPGSLVMDITYAPKETPLIRIAKEKGCEIIYGEEMFVNQANLQTNFWFR